MKITFTYGISETFVTGAIAAYTEMFGAAFIPKDQLQKLQQKIKGIGSSDKITCSGTVEIGIGEIQELIKTKMKGGDDRMFKKEIIEKFTRSLK